MSSNYYSGVQYVQVFKIVIPDQLNYRLKSLLRISPEQRYQDEKKNFLFHDLSCYMNDINDHDYNDDGSLKGCTGEGCVPECRFYPEYGRIEDDEVIQEHREIEERCKKNNEIIFIDIEGDEDTKRDYLKFLDGWLY
jgi:hypothetical protein